MSFYAVILCAGNSSRMGGKRQKGLLPVLGTPIVRHVAASLTPLKPSKTVVVVGFDSDSVVECLSPGGTNEGVFRFILQKKQQGTGHALSTALEAIAGKRGNVVVINGDMPAVTGALIKKLVSNHGKNDAAVSFVTALAENADGYGRVVRGRSGEPEKIVEHRDASADEKKIREVNAGIYCFAISFLRDAIGSLEKKNAGHEYYITDLVEAALRGGKRVCTVVSADFGEIAGVNTREELAAAQTFMRETVNARLIRRGVVILDPATSYVCPETKIGRGTIIHPCCFINSSSIGADCVIESGSQIKNSKLAGGCRVEFSSMLDGCVMRAGATAGPFARLRPGSLLMEGAKAGSFVEIKKSSVGKNSKVPHLSYIGDSELGARVNIGAGTITCNYDGADKHRTKIGDGVFIGSDTMLVAPVKIGKGAATGAGSVITKDVSPNTLAVGRSRQKEIGKWRKPAGGKEKS